MRRVKGRLDRPYLRGERGTWIKSKCLNRAEFIIVGWSEPEGARPLLGALLLGYLRGRWPTDLCGPRRDGHAAQDPRLAPRAPSALGDQDDAPRQSTTAQPAVRRLAGALKVHWVRPELVAEITYMSLADDGLLRHTVFLGLREDKPAREGRREAPRRGLIEFNHVCDPTRFSPRSLKCDGERF
jgi:bifunctional non-homologous end joining protein LigD